MIASMSHSSATFNPAITMNPIDPSNAPLRLRSDLSHG
jgi:hypothetical protein